MKIQGTAVTAALLSALALSGCGSSSGSVATTLTGPLSTSSADIAAFASQGETTTIENGVERTKNTATDGAGVHTAYVDGLPGSDVSRVTYIANSGEAIYRVLGTPQAVTHATTGIYSGNLDLTWRDGADDALHSDSGRMAIYLDMENGQAFVDSIVGGNNGANVIQVLGDASVNDGRLTGESMAVIVGDATGSNMRTETGSLDGLIANGSNTTAIMGTVESINLENGFHMTGGFSAGRAPDMPDTGVAF